MAKRFIEPNWKVLRLLSVELQRAWFYIWDKADNAGVYHFDNDYLKLDLSLKIDLNLQDLATLPECEILPGERILIKNFLVVNYTQLKHNYNPHKPAFRDLQKNGLSLNSSLNQACLKLEDEDIKEDEDEDEVQGGTGEIKIQLSPNGFWLDEIDKNLPIPEFSLNNTIQFIERAIQVKLSKEEVINQWEAFKLNHFDQRIWKNNKQELFIHFRNSLKKQLENGAAKNNNGSRKAGTSTDRTEALRKW